MESRREKRLVASVPGLCALLGSSRLLTADEVAGLEQRWRREVHNPGDLEQFTRWLVANQYATDFQVAMLLRGHASSLFLGPYKLLQRIGRGRLAMVYKAVHRLGRLAAVKVLPPSRARDPQALARFQREARLAQDLGHVNVVRTLEAGADHGLHYLAMEYLEGETLQELLDRRQRLGVEEAADVVYQALLGLQHLHERGLVHRNLEPADLMLVPPAGGVGLVVKILDISLGRSSYAEPLPEGQGSGGVWGGTPPHTHTGRLTREGLPQGPPSYRAPEQARDAHAADIRADIYSLGCIFYHTLTGQPPFQDHSPARELLRHATAAPPPLRECNPEIPEGLERIVNWMMAKDPARRYQTPEQAAGALLTFLTGERGSGGDVGGGTSPPHIPPRPLPEPQVSWLFSADVSAEASAGQGGFPEQVRGPDCGGVSDNTRQPAAPEEAAGLFDFNPAPENAGAAKVEDWAGPFLFPSESGTDGRESDTSLDGKGRAAFRRPPGLNRRDCLLLVLGAGGLLAAEAIGFFLGQLSRRLRAGKAGARGNSPG